MSDLFENYCQNNEAYEDWNKPNTGPANHYCISEIHFICSEVS